MTNSFYRAFEDEFRGSRELIVDRLKVYLDFVIPLHEKYPDGLWADLGCGRGEWLELLDNIKVNSLGVDTNEGMLSACIELGLNVYLDDAVFFLRRQADESLVGITAFHIAEHLSSDQLHDLMAESFRVLKPGGVLIIETPNPENILVGSCKFYLDQTHVKPLPPQLLEFMSKYYGFHRSVVLRLQEPEQLIISGAETLMDVFSGVSPDYAVVSQKFSTDPTLESLDFAFTRRSGLRLEELTISYHEKNEIFISEAKKNNIVISDELKAFSMRLNELDISLNKKLDNIISDLSDKYFEARNLSDHRLDIMTSRALQAEEGLIAVYKSNSWRVTYPLRWLSHSFRILKIRKIWSRFKLGVLFYGFIDFLYKYPKLKRNLSRLATVLGVHSILRKVYLGSINRQEQYPDFDPSLKSLSQQQCKPLGSLSVDEILARINLELLAIEQEKGGGND